jgi:gas vesicle protein
MRDHDDLPYIVIERRSGGLTPFVWGALLGAGAALLLAPRSGQETQDEIRRSAQRLRTGVEDRVTHARDTVTDAVTRTRDLVTERVDSVRDAVESRADQARHALDTGRRTARDARSELERRVAEAKHTYQSAADRVRGTTRPPAGDVVVTDVTVEEAEGQPDLG